MDQQMAGLQVLNGGRWVAVNPRPNALVVNVGDQLQVATQAALSEPGTVLTAACIRTAVLSEYNELVIDINGGDRLQVMMHNFLFSVNCIEPAWRNTFDS